MADRDRETDSNSSLSMGKSAQESGLGYVPERYMVPTSLRPSSSREMSYDLPVVDLAGLTRDSDQRSLVVDAIRDACRHFGFFHVSNDVTNKTYSSISIYLYMFSLLKKRMKKMIVDVIFQQA